MLDRMCSDAVIKNAFIFTGILLLLVVLPLQIWLFTVVLNCYRYLRDKVIAATSLPTTYAAVKSDE